MTGSPDRPPQDGMRQDEGFLTRWSRRKRNAREADAAAPAAESPAAPVPAPDVRPQATAPAPAPAGAAQAPGDEDMPPLESLGADSDVSAFFSPRVSEALRRAALRRIFHQPAFNESDGLDPYLTDFRNLKPLGNVVTADMRLALERARERMDRLADPPAGEAAASTADPTHKTGPAAANGASADAVDQAGEEHRDA